eukprot:123679-Amphidinium_carterae.1
MAENLKSKSVSEGLCVHSRARFLLTLGNLPLSSRDCGEKRGAWICEDRLLRQTSSNIEPDERPRMRQTRIR